MKRFLGVLAAAGMAVALTVPAAAQQQAASPEGKYTDFQKAVFAQQGCSKVQFTQDQFNQLDKRIIELVGQTISPARKLTLIQNARGEISNDIAYRGGCANPEVAAALSVFQRDLATAVTSK